MGLSQHVVNHFYCKKPECGDLSCGVSPGPVSFCLYCSGGVGVGFSLVLCLWKSLMLALLTDTEGGVSSLGGVGLQVASVLGG